MPHLKILFLFMVFLVNLILSCIMLMKKVIGKQ